MKKQLLFPLIAAAGGAAVFALRLVQHLTGFEPDTGLPIPGHFAGIVALLLLVAVTVALALLARQLPAAESAPVFPKDFFTADTTLLMIPVAGVFLMAISGIMDILLGAGLLRSGAVELPGIGVVYLFASGGYAPILHLLMGALTLISAAGLFLAAAACRKPTDRTTPPIIDGIWLLPPVVSMVVRLVFTYRTVSVNPALQAYYVELLALVLLTLGFYRLASFAFHAGSPRLFSFYSGTAVVLAVAALADSRAYLPATLLYAGSAAVLLGFLLLLWNESTASSEESDAE